MPPTVATSATPEMPCSSYLRNQFCKVVDMGEASYIVRTSGYIRSLKDLEDASLGVRDDVPITLRRPRKMSW